MYSSEGEGLGGYGGGAAKSVPPFVAVSNSQRGDRHGQHGDLFGRFPGGPGAGPYLSAVEGLIAGHGLREDGREREGAVAHLGMHPHLDVAGGRGRRAIWTIEASGQVGCGIRTRLKNPGQAPADLLEMSDTVPRVVIRILLGDRLDRADVDAIVGVQRACLGDGHHGRVGAGLQLLPLDVELADVDDQGEQSEEDTEDEEDGEDRRYRTAVVTHVGPSVPPGQLRHGMTLSPVNVTSPPSPMRTPSGVTNPKV